jgi:ABC-type transporter Mla maintaining outer membrane lipid asymmetry ATPase subunit MlaF
MTDASLARAEPVLELIGVDVASPRQPETPVLSGLNWTVARGDFWILGGLQGAGKTELLFTLAALHPPTRGVCRLFGREIAPGGDEATAERLRVGLVFAGGGRLFNHLTVRENVALPLQYHRPADDADNGRRVQALLEATGTLAWADLPPSRVTPSWRQRVGLARALALGPELLLLDDPTAGMDSCHGRWWFDFLDQLHAGHPLMGSRPVTLVVATNDFRPWLDPKRRYALLDGQRLRLLPGLPSLQGPEVVPVVRDLLALALHPIEP